MAKMNIRQQELKQQMKAMLRQAIEWSKDEELSYYTKEIDKDDFLAHFGVFHSAGHYARLRYFNDFKKLKVFDDTKNKGKFTVNYEKAKKLERTYGVKMPEPKAKTEV